MLPAPLDAALTGLNRRLPTVAVGIDLGQSSCRVVALRKSGRGGRLIGTASSRPGATVSGVADARQLRGLVEFACAASPWAPRRIAMAVAARSVLLRDMVIDDEVEDATDVVDRVTRTLPLTPAAVRVAWTRLSGHRALLVAAHGDQVSARQALASESQIGRVVVDVDVFAGLRAVGVGALEGGEASTTILVDLGSDSVRLLAWSVRQSPVLRVVPLPQQFDESHLVQLIASALVEWGGHSDRAAAVVLAGGRACAPGLHEALQARTALNLSTADPFAGLELSVCELPPAAERPAWVNALGLALRGLA